VSVAKTIELSGTSSDGFEAAINDVIAKAGETLRNIEGAWVKEQKVVVSDGRVTGYRVHLEVTFVLD
jgi:flavin-binding protein dodecin